MPGADGKRRIDVEGLICKNVGGKAGRGGEGRKGRNDRRSRCPQTARRVTGKGSCLLPPPRRNPKVNFYMCFHEPVRS